jgi:hypothetical protein
MSEHKTIGPCIFQEDGAIYDPTTGEITLEKHKPVGPPIFQEDGTIFDRTTGEISSSKIDIWAPTPDDPIVNHALYYAIFIDWSVFPSPATGEKKGIYGKNESNGYSNWGMTTDADKIERYWRHHPDANVCIATGAESGIFVLEGDTKQGHDVDGIASIAALEAEHGALPATLMAISPSGSVHRYFKHPGFKIKNSASAIAPGVDVRGDGGMVMAPPSVKPGKGAYRWLNDLPIAEAPQWLLDRIAAGKDEPESEPELSISERALANVRPRDGFDDIADQVRSRGNGAGYIEAALNGEYDEVVRAPKGKRNAQLNTSSLKLGHYVGGGELDEKTVIDTMMKACAASGLLNDDGGKSACLATIRSGLEEGKRQPKGIPERKAAPADSVVTGDSGTPDGAAAPPTGATLTDNVRALRPVTPLAMTLFDDVENYAKKEWLLKGAIAKGETSMWIAPPKKLKSALMTDISIHLASGTDWRGYRSKETCGVVYFAFERADLVKRRLAGHRRRDGLTGLPIATVGRIIDLIHPGCVEVIVATIREASKKLGCNVGFAVFDTFAKGLAAGGGDENQAKDMGVALANLRRVQEQTGVHIAIVHHTGKDESKGARGSNSQLGDVDVMVQISGDGAVKVATVTAANDQAEGELTKFKGEIVKLGTDEDGDEITTMIISADDCGMADGSAVKVKLNDTERRAMNLLYDALNDSGKDAPASDVIPYGAKVVPVDVWRDRCKRGGLSNGQADSAFRTAFNRATTKLANLGRIGMVDGLVWVAYD